MNIKPIGSNKTELRLDNGTTVLFSYETPVAAWINGQYYKTEQKWSRTTSKHINAWAHLPVTKPQSFFNELIKGV